MRRPPSCSLASASVRPSAAARPASPTTGRCPGDPRYACFVLLSFRLRSFSLLGGKNSWSAFGTWSKGASCFHLPSSLTATGCACRRDACVGQPWGFFFSFFFLFFLKALVHCVSRERSDGPAFALFLALDLPATGLSQTAGFFLQVIMERPLNWSPLEWRFADGEPVPGPEPLDTAA